MIGGVCVATLLGWQVRFVRQVQVRLLRPVISVQPDVDDVRIAVLVIVVSPLIVWTYRVLHADMYRRFLRVIRDTSFVLWSGCHLSLSVLHGSRLRRKTFDVGLLWIAYTFVLFVRVVFVRFEEGKGTVDKRFRDR